MPHGDIKKHGIKFTAVTMKGSVAGPRGFEPRVSGFGGLRTFLVGLVRRLNPGWATGPLFFHEICLYNLKFCCKRF